MPILVETYSEFAEAHGAFIDLPSGNRLFQDGALWRHYPYEKDSYGEVPKDQETKLRRQVDYFHGIGDLRVAGAVERAENRFHELKNACRFGNATEADLLRQKHIVEKLREEADYVLAQWEALPANKARREQAEAEEQRHQQRAHDHLIAQTERNARLEEITI